MTRVLNVECPANTQLVQLVDTVEYSDREGIHSCYNSFKTNNCYNSLKFLQDAEPIAINSPVLAPFLHKWER